MSLYNKVYLLSVETTVVNSADSNTLTTPISYLHEHG